MTYKIKSCKRATFSFACTVGKTEMYTFADTEKDAISLLVESLRKIDASATILIESKHCGVYVAVEDYNPDEKEGFWVKPMAYWEKTQNNT